MDDPLTTSLRLGRCTSVVTLVRGLSVGFGEYPFKESQEGDGVDGGRTSHQVSKRELESWGSGGQDSHVQRRDYYRKQLG